MARNVKARVAGNTGMPKRKGPPRLLDDVPRVLIPEICALAVSDFADAPRLLLVCKGWRRPVKLTWPPRVRPKICVASPTMT